MLHSVGNTHTDWIYNFLSVKLVHIENLFSYLKKSKINSFFIKDLYDNDFNVPKKGIALTFDDGYVDNWVYLFPLLQKYELKATLFVNPEFIDNRNIVREKLTKEVNNMEKDRALGFLSWNEMIEMEKSGLVDIQSHSMSHSWYFSEPDVIDFYLPSWEHRMKYPWVSWNEKPDQKPFTHNTFAYNSTKYGLPIFSNGRSLGITRFFPDEEIINGLIKFTEDNSEVFNYSVKEALNKKFTNLTAGRKEIGRYETDAERKDRYWYELYESKNILEKKLNKEVIILCWPGGAYNETSLGLSEECGYVASTVWSKDTTPVNNKNKKYKRIHRKSMAGNVGLKGKNYGPSFQKNFLIHENFPYPFISAALVKAEKLLKLILKKLI